MRMLDVEEADEKLIEVSLALLLGPDLDPRLITAASSGSQNAEEVRRVGRAPQGQGRKPAARPRSGKGSPAGGHCRSPSWSAGFSRSRPKTPRSFRVRRQASTGSRHRSGAVRRVRQGECGRKLRSAAGPDAEIGEARRYGDSRQGPWRRRTSSRRSRKGRRQRRPRTRGRCSDGQNRSSQCPPRKKQRRDRLELGSALFSLSSFHKHL